MKRFRTHVMILALLLLLGTTCFGGLAGAAGGVALYTPYTSLTAAPGESLNYSIDVINSSADIQKVQLEIANMPDQWKYDLTAGGHKVQEISVKPNETQSVQLQVNVPLKITKGTYQFTVAAKGAYTLPLTVNVAETGEYQTVLDTQQPNMEGHADSTFNYSATIHNKTASKQLYALKAQAPAGWDVQFTANSKNVTSVSVDPNASQDISITVTPPDSIKAGTYKIPISATAGGTTATSGLEAVVTGTYALDLSTSSGNLNADVTAGSTKNITLKITNKGSSPLSGIEMSASTPSNWEVDFSPKKINTLAAGQSTEVVASIKADGKAIAGDYVVTLTAQTPEKTANADLRMTVRTSILWGWIGILIILAVLGGVYSIFRTYGRR